MTVMPSSAISTQLARAHAAEAVGGEALSHEAVQGFKA